MQAHSNTDQIQMSKVSTWNPVEREDQSRSTYSSDLSPQVDSVVVSLTRLMKISPQAVTALKQIASLLSDCGGSSPSYCFGSLPPSWCSSRSLCFQLEGLMRGTRDARDLSCWRDLYLNLTEDCSQTPHHCHSLSGDGFLSLSIVGGLWHGWPVQLWIWAAPPRVWPAGLQFLAGLLGHDPPSKD